MLGLDGRVVDRHPLGLHVLAHDRQHRRLLAGQGDRVVDHVLEAVAELPGGGGTADRAGVQPVGKLLPGVPRVPAVGVVRLHRLFEPVERLPRLLLLGQVLLRPG